MADPVIINPKLTTAGQAAAFAADNNGLDLKITHVSFGLAHYNPTGAEKALKQPVGNKVLVAGASRPTPNQIRMVSSWREDVGYVGIGEIAWWSNDILVFIWSNADGTNAAYKTDGVAYVLFNDLQFSAVPANSISFKVDPNESVALAALAAHEGAYNAHPQYILRARFPDYQGHLWGATTGTANAITLALPAIVELTQYALGNRFTFKAKYTNTGAVTININGVGAVEVLKTGGIPCTAGSILAGGVYDVYHDGSKFQLTAGAGFASAEATEAEINASAETDSTSWVSVRRLQLALNGSRESAMSLASAMHSEQLRGLQREDQLNEQSRQQADAKDQIGELKARTKAVEVFQGEAREGQLSASLAIVTAIHAEQLRGLQREDRLNEQSRQQTTANTKIEELQVRTTAAEQFQTEARDGLLSAAFANATGLIALQLTVTKQIYGA